ncbi:MAG: bifunctional folylpolyglutamate synthase/dihydrofolate synthase [Dehalococcoidia bacterium]
MEYRQAIDYLLTLVDHERPQPTLPRQKRIYDLGRMEALLRHLGDPHLTVPTIHIAGTKGKGSVAALCDSALHAAGYHTGFYSSPHLHSFCERLRRDTNPISEEQFAGLVEQLWPHQQWVKENTDLGPVSLFEFMTGMAFHCFAQDGADFQVIEVGLGGRLDATNVVHPRVCVVTSISLDHTAILGDTIAEIAAEKAGIIKPGSTVVIAPQVPEALSVVLAICAERGARPIRVGSEVTWRGEDSDIEGQTFSVQGRRGEYRLRTPLLGEYQLENAATAVATLEVLQEQGDAIPEAALEEGFAHVSWPCRMEVLSRSPLVVADGAHNAHSVNNLMESLPRYLDYRRLLLIAGFSRDKSVDDMVARLSVDNPPVFATRSRHPRSVAPASLAEQFRKQGVTTVTEADSVAEALAQALAMAQPGDLILGTGSLFLAAEVREAMLGIEPEVYPDLLPPDLRSPSTTV